MNIEHVKHEQLYVKILKWIKMNKLISVTKLILLSVLKCIE